MGDVDWGKVAVAGGTGAAAGTAVNPGIGTAVGGVVMGGIELFRQLFGHDPSDDELKQFNAQYAAGNGAELTNHLAALDYSEGLTQQQSQNAREAGFYSQAQGNFDIGNAAQLREAPQVAGSAVDQARQLDALNQTNQAGQQLSSTGNLLTDLGTRPMGDSYAEAQLRQGQNAAMAQQLSMARSGRSLGSGQAAMANAAFNNASLNQQTNQAAAGARIQEQNAYNQFQANALGQAGNQYGAAGNAAGQAGNQATTIRTGNEGLQKTNADLAQNQQGINNQTTGLYNDLGVKQEGLGMDANRLGTNAFQFGAQQGANKQIAQLNANVGQTSSNAAVELAGAARDERREAGETAALSTAAGTAAEALGSSGGGASTPAPSNPNDAYKNITTASHVTPTGGPTPPGSDEKNKTGITPLEPTTAAPPKKGEPGYAKYLNDQIKYKGMTPEQEASTRAADDKAASDWEKGIAPSGPKIDDDTNKIPTAPEPAPGPKVASYVDTINALNNAYRPSQFAPADILNNVPGAGSGHSASQNSVIERMMRKPGPAQGSGPRVANDALLAPRDYAMGPTMTGSQLSALGHAGALGKAPPEPANAPSVGGTGGGRFPSQKAGLGQMGVSAPPPAAAPPPPAWGDVFNAPQLSDPVSLYLQGYDPYVAPPTPVAAAPVAHANIAPTSQQYQGNEQNWKPPVTEPRANQYRGSENTTANQSNTSRDPRSGIESKKNIFPLGPLSDDRSKGRIRELEGQLEALGGAAVQPKPPDYAALDDAYARSQRPEGVDFRNAHGYTYEYKNPKQPGAVPGVQVGTMAQELERTDAAPYVHDSPSGKRVDTSRLPLALAPAIGHTQRRVDDLERQLDALKGSGFGSYRPELYPSPRGP